MLFRATLCVYDLRTAHVYKLNMNLLYKPQHRRWENIYVLALPITILQIDVTRLLPRVILTHIVLQIDYLKGFKKLFWQIIIKNGFLAI